MEGSPRESRRTRARVSHGGHPDATPAVSLPAPPVTIADGHGAPLPHMPMPTRAARSVGKVLATYVETSLCRPWEASNVDTGAGSGWFVDVESLSPGLRSGREGRPILLTCAHCVRNASEDDEGLQVSVERMVYPARVLAVIPEIDLSVLEVYELDPDTVVPLRLGDDLDAEQGDPLLVYGYPLNETGLKQSPCFLNGREDGLLQLDGSINEGNSGGPVVDRWGDVKGWVVKGIEHVNSVTFAQPAFALHAFARGERFRRALSSEGLPRDGRVLYRGHPGFELKPGSRPAIELAEIGWAPDVDRLSPARSTSAVAASSPVDGGSANTTGGPFLGVLRSWDSGSAPPVSPGFRRSVPMVARRIGSAGAIAPYNGGALPVSRAHPPRSGGRGGGGGGGAVGGREGRRERGGAIGGDDVAGGGDGDGGGGGGDYGTHRLGYEDDIDDDSDDNGDGDEEKGGNGARATPAGDGRNATTARQRGATGRRPSPSAGTGLASRLHEDRDRRDYEEPDGREDITRGGIVTWAMAALPLSPGDVVRSISVPEGTLTGQPPTGDRSALSLPISDSLRVSLPRYPEASCSLDVLWAMMPPGAEFFLDVVRARSGRRKNLRWALGEGGEPNGCRRRSYPPFLTTPWECLAGIVVREIDEEIAHQFPQIYFGLPREERDMPGIAVVCVLLGAPLWVAADEPTYGVVSPGSVISRINGLPTRTVVQLREAVRRPVEGRYLVIETSDGAMEAMDMDEVVEAEGVIARRYGYGYGYHSIQ